MIKEKNIFNFFNIFDANSLLDINLTCTSNVSFRHFLTLNYIYSDICKNYFLLDFEFILKSSRFKYKDIFAKQKIYSNKNALKFYNYRSAKNLDHSKVFSLKDIYISKYIDIFSIFSTDEKVFGITAPNYFSSKTIVCPILYRLLYKNAYESFQEKLEGESITYVLNAFFENFKNFLKSKKNEIYLYFIDLTCKLHENKSAYAELFDKFINFKPFFENIKYEDFENAVKVHLSHYIISNENIKNVNVSNLQDLISSHLKIDKHFLEFVDNTMDEIINIEKFCPFIKEVDFQFEFFANALLNLFEKFKLFISLKDIYSYFTFDKDLYFDILASYSKKNINSYKDIFPKLILHNTLTFNILKHFDKFVSLYVKKTDMLDIKSLFVIIFKTIEKACRMYASTYALDIDLDKYILLSLDKNVSFIQEAYKVVLNTVNLLPIYFIRNYMYVSL